MGRRGWLAALGSIAVGLFIPLAGLAQTGVVRNASPVPADVTAADRSGGTLDVPPRIIAPPPAAAEPAGITRVRRRQRIRSGVEHGDCGDQDDDRRRRDLISAHASLDPTVLCRDCRLP